MTLLALGYCVLIQKLTRHCQRPSSAINSVATTSMAPMDSPMNAINPASARRNNEQREVVRQRIFTKVTEKYPLKPIDFRERKVNKQMALLCKLQPSTFKSHPNLPMNLKADLSLSPGNDTRCCNGRQYFSHINSHPSTSRLS